MKALLALRSATSFDDSQPADPEFERLLEQVAERLQEGVPVDLEELAAEYPQYADRFGELLPAVEMLVRMGEAPVEQAAAGNDQAHIPQLGDFRIVRELGRGGMGVVYEAEQQRPVRRKVAVKVIKPGMDTREFIARFMAERQALALMDHPNIAKVFDAGATDSGRPYFVMELVPGVPITEYCDDGDFTTRDRLELFITVCRAVQHAHQKGVIHRDIKPTNVLVSMQDGRPMPKIIDFGVAKAMGQRLTEQTLMTAAMQVVGTPLYMSPEQAELNPQSVDTRSDIYSLGVLLYELLTGTTPFDRDRLRAASYDELRRIIREEEPPRPSRRISTLAADVATTVAERRGTDARRLSQTIRAELDWIVMRCLEKERNRRYESVGGLAADIERYLHDEPVDACPPSAWYRFRKFALRNFAALVTATLVSALLLTGTVISTWQAIRATRAEELAEQRLHDEEQARRSADAAQQSEAQQRRKAESIVVQSKLELGTRLLNERNSQGLLELFEARSVAENLPELQDATGQIWAVALQLWGGRLLEVLPGGEALAFSPDGRILAIVHKSQVFLWDVDRNDHLCAPLEHDTMLSGVAFSPNGRFVAAHSVEGVGRLWDVATGQPTSPLLEHDARRLQRHRPTNHYPDTLAFNADGSLLATGAADGTVRLWTVPEGEAYGSVLRCPMGVYAVAFSPDGRLLAASTSSTETTNDDLTQVFVWEVETGEPVLPPLDHGSANSIVKVLFNRHGDALVSVAHAKPDIRFWDIATGSVVWETEVQGGLLEDFVFSPDGSRAATAETNWTAKLWDVSSRDEEPLFSLRHQSRVRSVRFSPDGELLATASLDQHARLWEVETGRLASPYLPHYSEVWRVAFSPDGRLLASTGSEQQGKGGSTRVWKVRPAPWQPFSSVPAGEVLAISADSTRLAAASEDLSMIQIYRIWDGQPEGAPIPAPHGSTFSLTQCAFSPDRRLLVLNMPSVPRFTALRFWDIGAGHVLDRELEKGDASGAQHFYSPAFSGDGRRLAVGLMAFRAEVWDLATNRLIQSIFCHERAYAVALNHDGTRLVTGAGNSHVQQWDLDSGEPLGPPMRHQGRVVAVALSLDERIVASIANEDGRRVVRLWFLGLGPPYRHLVLPYEPSGRLLHFTADGDLLLSGESPGEVIRWPIPRPPQDLDEMRLRTWVALGTRLRDDGEVEAISPDDWRALREELAELAH